MSAAASDITGQAEGWMTAVVTPLKGCAREAVEHQPRRRGQEIKYSPSIFIHKLMFR